MQRDKELLPLSRVSRLLITTISLIVSLLKKIALFPCACVRVCVFVCVSVCVCVCVCVLLRNGVDSQRTSDIILMSMRRNCVASKLIRRHFGTIFRHGITLVSHENIFDVVSPKKIALFPCVCVCVCVCVFKDTCTSQCRFPAGT